MHSILSRRKVLSSAAAAAGAFAAGAPARAETNPSPDPDADAVLARMTKLSERGASLPLKSRHLVMLATLSAIGLPEHVESAVKAALRDGLTPRKPFTRRRPTSASHAFRPFSGPPTRRSPRAA